MTKPATGFTCSAASTWSTRASVPSAPTGVAASTSRNSQRAGRSRRGRSASAPGRVGQRGARGRGDVGQRHVERAAEHVEQPRAGERQASREHGMRRRRSAAGSLTLPGPPGRRRPSPPGRPSSCVRRPSKRGRHHVEMAHRFVQRAVGVLGGLVHQAGVERVERVFLGQPVGDRVVQRRRRAGRELRAAAQRGGAALDGRAGGVEVDRAERPRLQRGRIESFDLHFPFDPHRHPGLGPGGHADEVGVRALVQRELAHFVGHQRLLLAQARREHGLSRPARGAPPASSAWRGSKRRCCRRRCRHRRSAAPTRPSAGSAACCARCPAARARRRSTRRGRGRAAAPRARASGFPAARSRCPARR